MKATSAISALDDIARTISRNSLQRGRESRSAAGADKYEAEITEEVLKLSGRLCKSGKDLDRCWGVR